MFPFDNNAITVCKENKYLFFESFARIIYGEYTHHDYISKSLPGIAIENEEELTFITSIIGKEYIRVVNKNFIEFFDPEVIEFMNVTAPLCIIKDGHYTTSNKTYSACVPSVKMLEAAESLYGVIKLCIHNKLKKYREERFYTEFFKNSLDGMCSFIYSTLPASKMSSDFLILLKKKSNDLNMFFVVPKRFAFNKNKPEYIEFVISKENYGFVASRKEYLEKRLKVPITIKMKN